MTRVLVVEDDQVSRSLLAEILRGEKLEVDTASNGREAIDAAGECSYDLVVSDVKMEGEDGFDVLAAFQRLQPLTPVVLITAFGEISGAMAAIQKGAYDYVSKPFNVEEFRLAVRRALERRRLAAVEPAAPAEPAAPEIVGRSPGMLDVYKLVARVAPTQATVLVTGESGTGKELVARAIHKHSLRANAPFVPVNCTALSESLLESELFGHTKGAFTGAAQAKQGLFEEADGGTLFLDEIGDMGPKMQAQLLRALQDGEIRRVGGNDAVRVDVRLVCATHRDLESAVKAGKFREDLFFRIHVVTLHLPPLRSRPGDVAILVAHFLRSFGQRHGRKPPGVAPEAMALLERYPWPGNVRELENVLERGVTLAKGGVVLPSDLPEEVTLGVSELSGPHEDWAAESAPRSGVGTTGVGMSGAVHGTGIPNGLPSGLVEGVVPVGTGDGNRPTLAEVERRYIELVLAETGGNKKRAAEILGIDRRTLYRTLERTSGTALSNGTESSSSPASHEADDDADG